MDAQKKEQNSELGIFFVVLAGITVFALLIANLTMLGSLFACLAKNGWMLWTLTATHCGAWLLSGLLLLYLFIMRLKKVFGNTPFELNQVTFTILYICVGLVTVLGILTAIFIMFDHVTSFIIGFISVMLYLVLGIATLILFVYSLFNVIVEYA